MEKELPPAYGVGYSSPQYASQASPQHMGGPHYAPEAPPQHTGGPHYAPQAHPQHMGGPPIFHQPAPAVQTTVVVNSGGGALGGCPVCHNNSWRGTFGLCAWLWCLCCFPIGIICCCCMRQKKCTQCGYTTA